MPELSPVTRNVDKLEVRVNRLEERVNTIDTQQSSTTVLLRATQEELHRLATDLRADMKTMRDDIVRRLELLTASLEGRVSEVVKTSNKVPWVLLGFAVSTVLVLLGIVMERGHP